MNSKSMWQWLVLIIIVAFSVALTIPPKDKIRLGLDLKGGSSFTLELDKTAIETTVRERALQGDTEDEIQRRIDETMKTADDTAVEIIRKRIDSLGTEEPVITKSKKGRIYVQIPGATEEKRREAGELIRSVAFLEFRLVSTRSQELSAGLLAQGSAPQGYKTEVINGQNYYIRDPSVEAPACVRTIQLRQPSPWICVHAGEGKHRWPRGFPPDFRRPPPASHRRHAQPRWHSDGRHWPQYGHTVFQRRRHR